MGGGGQERHGQTRWTRATLGRPDRPLDLLTARFDHHRYAPHTHEEFSIGICVLGASCIDYRGGGLRVGEGSIVVLAPGEVHTGESAYGTYAYRALYPTPALLTDGILGGTPHFRDPLVHDPELAAALRSAHAELSTCPDPLEAESRLPWLLTALARRHSTSRAAPDAIPGAARSPSPYATVWPTNSSPHPPSPTSPRTWASPATNSCEPSARRWACPRTPGWPSTG